MANKIIEWDNRTWVKTGGKYYILQAASKNRTGEMLHRAIWKKYFGEIPDGYVIHHKDHNPENNDINNLECLSNREHCQKHMSEPERINKSTKTLEEIARPALQKWQKSEIGKQRLKEMGYAMQQKSYAKLIDAVCDVCGKPFKMHPTRGTGLCRKCGKREAAKRSYQRKKSSL